MNSILEEAYERLRMEIANDALTSGESPYSPPIQHHVDATINSMSNVELITNLSELDISSQTI